MTSVAEITEAAAPVVPRVPERRTIHVKVRRFEDSLEMRWPIIARARIGDISFLDTHAVAIEAEPIHGNHVAAQPQSTLGP